MIRRLSLRKLLPLGSKADTTVVLKSGDVILGRILAEDEDKLIMSVTVGQGSCTMNIERNLIQDIVHKKNKNK